MDDTAQAQAPGATQTRNESLTGSHWHVWKAISNLQAADRRHDYQGLTDEIIRILQLWASEWAGLPAWQSLLNKKSLQHEIEESMVALYHLQEWRKKRKLERFVAVDVCGGKGIFSMLLQYMASLYWNQDGASQLDSIILLEKSTEEQIDWAHLRAPIAGKKKTIHELVTVHLWSDCNLHDYDNLVNRFRDIPYPLAMTGIHLCKGLSPAMLSLVNLLGSHCQYFCLAPCCMPRVVTSKNLEGPKRCLQVYQYESHVQRDNRLLQQRQRTAAKRKGLVHGECFLCHSTDHWVRHCPLFPSDPDEQSRLLQEAAVKTPCWNCGKAGHFKSDCPNKKAGVSEPPVAELNVSTVLAELNPLPLYCQLLLTTVQGPTDKTLVIETGLSNESKHQQGNWNSFRKAVYIVASR